MGLLNLPGAADRHFCPDAKPGLPRGVFCMSLVAAEGNAEQVCLMLPVQPAFTLLWAELNLTWAVKSQEPLEGQGEVGNSCLRKESRRS